MPAIGLGNGLNSFGGGEPFVTRNHTFQFLDNFSWINGRHTISSVGSFAAIVITNLETRRRPASFFIAVVPHLTLPTATQPAMHYADFLIGEVSEAARALQVANGMLRASSYYAYIQDDWKITPRLTLNLGLRYENTRPWKDKYRGIMNVQMFDPGVGANGLLPASKRKFPSSLAREAAISMKDLAFRFHDGIPIQAGDQFIGRSLVNPDNNDFAPRIGIAYSPTDRWTFRTGFGLFYTKDSGNLVFDMARNHGGSRLYCNSDERARAIQPQRSMGVRSVRLYVYRLDRNLPGALPGPRQHCGPPHALRDQWLFNIQRQLTDDLAARNRIPGQRGHKLERFRTYNQAVLKTGPTMRGRLRNVAVARLWPHSGSRWQCQLELSRAQRQDSAEILPRAELHGAFTCSKAIDGGSALRTNSGDRLWPTNSYDLRQERGPSQFHVGQRFVSSALYELPFGRANSGFLKELSTAGKLAAS